MTTPEPTPVVEPDTPESGKGLRAQLEKSNARANKYKTQLLATAYDDLGLKADEGLGKAIAKEYDGEPNAEALATFAEEEYGYTKPEPVEVNEQAQRIAQEQQNLDTAAATAGSIVSPTTEELLAKAEAEGDVQTSMAIKGAQVAAMFQPGR